MLLPVRATFKRELRVQIWVPAPLDPHTHTHRQTDKAHVIEANRRDIEIALELYDRIAEANELGIPPQLLNWYKTVMIPIWESESEIADRKTILRKHLEVYHQPLNRHRLEQEFIPSLESANLLTEEHDPDDRRRILYMPLRNHENNVPDMCDTPSYTPRPLTQTTITHPGDIVSNQN